MEINVTATWVREEGHNFLMDFQMVSELSPELGGNGRR